MSTISRCPACGRTSLTDLYEVEDVPVHSVVLLHSRQQAVDYPTGDLCLSLCHDCGFIFNRRFSDRDQAYADDYEETQGFSSTFRSFHRDLADRLVAKFDLDGDRILEIGCGKGEFLSLLCARSGGSGIGFDPAFVEERSRADLDGRIRIVKDYYSEHYAHVDADLVCCKMTLEHIPDVARFVRTVRSALSGGEDTVVYFQVPEVRRILRECAFWDVYYEHCSYFCPTSLAQLFRRVGFEVDDVWTEYDEQYLMMSARPGDGEPVRIREDPSALAEIEYDALRFAEWVSCARRDWKQRLAVLANDGVETVLWGGGSKAVAFLTTLSVEDEVAAVVDVNPHKHGSYLPGTGHRVIGPCALPEYDPDLVLVMNPVYEEEIREELAGLDLRPVVWAVSDGPGVASSA